MAERREPQSHDQIHVDQNAAFVAALEQLRQRWRAELSGDRERRAIVLAFAIFGLFFIADILVRIKLDEEKSLRSSREFSLRFIENGWKRWKKTHSQPLDDIRDNDGRPLLSWRVRILPYIDEHELYSRFHRNEPWNSPHNIQLLSLMPRVYQNPSLPRLRVSSSPENIGKTVYLAFRSSASSLNSDIGNPASRLPDRSDAAIVAVAAIKSQPVFWTKPEDSPPASSFP